MAVGEEIVALVGKPPSPDRTPDLAPFEGEVEERLAL